MSNSVAVNQSEVKMGYHIYGVTVVSQAQAAKRFGHEDAAQKAPMQGSMYFTLNSPEYYLYNIAYKTYNVPLSIDWRWLLAYHERLAEGATADRAYDYADAIMAQPINDGPFADDYTDAQPAENREEYIGYD
jgi:hypothetical protein